MSNQYYTIALKKIVGFLWVFDYSKDSQTQVLSRGEKKLTRTTKTKNKTKQKKMHKFSFFSVQLKTPVFIHLCYQGEEKCHYHGYLFQTAFVTINITHLIEKEL